MKICPICDLNMEGIFNHKVLNKYNVNYFQCYECELIQTEKQYWVEEAYTSAITIADTGLTKRNISLAAQLAIYLLGQKRHRGVFLDYAGGYGMLTRIMRDYGFNYFWHDEFCQNLLALGFEKEPDKNYDIISAFEVLEHLEDPLEFFNKIFKDFGAQQIIFSTVLYQGPKAPDLDWWYYAFHSGQHVSFFSKKTLSVIASKLNVNYYNLNGFQIFSKEKIRFEYLTKNLLKFSIFLSALIPFFLTSKTMDDHNENIKKYSK
jgi:hypothetical protein